MIVLVKKADDFLARVEKWVISILSGALLLILMCQVVLRYAFSRPLFWAEEISVQLLVFITLVGLSLLLKARQMIAIDMIIGVMPPKWKKGVTVGLQLLSLLVIVFFAYHGTLWILRPETRMELSPTTGLPIWINFTLFPITFYCMAVHLAAGLITMTSRQGQTSC